MKPKPRSLTNFLMVPCGMRATPFAKTQTAAPPPESRPPAYGLEPRYDPANSKTAATVETPAGSRQTVDEEKSLEGLILCTPQFEKEGALARPSLIWPPTRPLKSYPRGSRVARP